MAPPPAPGGASVAAPSSPPGSPRRRRSRRAAFGSTRRLPSGRWQARYLDADGSRRSAPRTFVTQREAEDWLAASRADLLRGTFHSPALGAVPLSSFAADYLTMRVDLAPTTAVMYRSLLSRWLCTDLPHPVSSRPVNLGRLELRQITPATVREWHASALARAQASASDRAAASDRRRRSRALHAARVWARDHGHPVGRTGRLPAAVLQVWRASGSPAAATLQLPPQEPPRDAGRVQVAQAYRLLRSILTAAHRDGLIPANPCTLPGAGAVRARERVPATVDEVTIIAAQMPPRYAAAVHVAAWSGLRAGELFALSRAHVNLGAGTLRVERALTQLPGEPPRFGPPKTTTSLRTVHLPAPVVTLLTQHMATFTGAGPDALVFAREDGTPLPSRRRTVLFRAACTAVGRDDLRWHDLRHTGATAAAQAGASLRELQARLGHSTITAAMTYQHATLERDRELAVRMAALLTPPGQPRLRLVHG